MRGEWIRGLSLNFNNPVGRGRVSDVCMCLSCDGVGGECEEWVRVRVWVKVLEGWL